MILSFNNRVIKFGGILDYVPSSTPSIVTDGLVLYLDAGNPLSYTGLGIFWNDLSPFGDNGVLSGPTFNSENGGNLVFDGLNDYVLCNPISTSINANAGLTMCVWVKVAVGETQAGLLSYSTLTNNDGVRLQIYNGPLSFTLGGVADYSTGINISDDSWKYVSSVSLNNTAQIYINGVLMSTISIGTMLGGVLDTYIIGALSFSNSYRLNGSIAQVHTYNRELTPTEVYQNFIATKNRYGL